MHCCIATLMEKRAQRETWSLFHRRCCCWCWVVAFFTRPHSLYILSVSTFIYFIAAAQHTQMCWQHGVAECISHYKSPQHISKGEDLLHLLLLGLLLLPDVHYRLPTAKSPAAAAVGNVTNIQSPSVSTAAALAVTSSRYLHSLLEFSLLCCCVCLCVNNRTEVSSCRASCFDTRKTWFQLHFKERNAALLFPLLWFRLIPTKNEFLI
jgi:hypothetical protein